MKLLECNRELRKELHECRRYHDYHGEDWLFMTVADGDFKLTPAIREALINKVDAGNLVYSYFDEQLYQAIKNWYLKRYNLELKLEEIIHGNGVMHLMQVGIETFSAPGDGVIIQTPVYEPFLEVIEHKKRKVIMNKLIYNSKAQHYEIDFKDLEEKLKDPVNKILILCSPHNPVGRVWTETELQNIYQLVKKYNKIIISDEIWQDIVYQPYHHHPMFSMEKDSNSDVPIITLSSQGKTYNLGGLQYGYAIIKDPEIRIKFAEMLQAQIHYASNNVLTSIAVCSGYNDPEAYEWYQEYLSALWTNYQYIKNELEKHTKIKVINSEGTYLVWLDLSFYCQDDKDVTKYLNQARILANEGIDYGQEYCQFVRINYATHFIHIKSCVERLVRVFSSSEGEMK
ncbi:MalY/PatB family protein [Spiroplasma eriocheiris]|uniref:cysteine-S-conjugate beta-lyase n=1 Tax=Spiroplasma eriocheiris TaxID=315358 RepID=A0A0H3XHJ0_9MOLU|nr:aminotransferase class I/II-fold pyridoxal phosphate-dependent enzyme [Spiroplasma eriocheiris]AHF57727.1 putative aminotransferase [Spiroplasma eriocheiris CCTCC M 207170]AKM54178.1 cystathionine beta-lyase [Spiroplasma eriocheiris]